MDTTKSKNINFYEGTSNNHANTDPGAAQPQPIQGRIVQNFLLIWLDSKFDENHPDFKKSMQELRRIVVSVNTFTDAQDCIDSINKIKREKAFMIVSGVMGRQIVPQIESLPQMESIYVFCGNKAVHEQWASKISKVKGVYTEIEQICEALQVDCKTCDRNMIPISFSSIDALFMYTQLLKEAVLQIEDDDEKSIKDLVDFCRQQNDIDREQIKQIEREYRNHTPIWWYTGETFLYTVLNRGLRKMDTDVIMNMGFFIRHLHQHIAQLYRQQQSGKSKLKKKFTVFRGQGLQREVFERMKNSNGGLMSFNSFLSTTCNQEVSLDGFARRAASQGGDTVDILFVMAIDTDICDQCNFPFADVSEVGSYKGDEAELLFTTHTIFRINNFRQLHNEHSDRLWEMKLTLTGNNENQLNNLTAYMRPDMQSTGLAQLGEILLNIGEPGKAEQLYEALLQKASNENERANYLYMLGRAYADIADYSKALSSHEKSLEIMKIALPPNHPDLARSYNNIGEVYSDIGEYAKALSSYEMSLEIKKIALPLNHPDLAESYNNIGSVYFSMGEYSNALSQYKRSLDMRKKGLPPNHPDVGMSYMSIGSLLSGMGEYFEALDSLHQALAILKIVLPLNHRSLAVAYENIAWVLARMGEYSEALSANDQALKIFSEILSENHPDFANCQNNMGEIYYYMGVYLTALSLHKQALQKREAALSHDHPAIAESHNNLGLVYEKLGEYSKALTHHKRAIEIREKTPAGAHLDLAACYNDIAAVYTNLHEFSESLSFNQKALDIRQRKLAVDHPDLAKSYYGIGSLFERKGDFCKALKNYQEAQRIWGKKLPLTHPYIAMVKKKIQIVKDKM